MCISHQCLTKKQHHRSEICIIKHALKKNLNKLAKEYEFIAKRNISYSIPAKVFLERLR